MDYFTDYFRKEFHVNGERTLVFLSQIIIILVFIQPLRVIFFWEHYINTLSFNIANSHM